MESLEHDLLPRDDDAAAAFGVRLHRFDAAVERALRDMESDDDDARCRAQRSTSTRRPSRSMT